MEKLFEEASRHTDKILCSARFGNIINSKGSLIGIWKANPNQDIKLTHIDVSRFFFTAHDAAETVVQALTVGQQGEIFIKKMKKIVILL